MIQAGGIMSSMALGLMLGSGSSSRAVTRLGTWRAHEVHEPEPVLPEPAIQERPA